MTKDVFWQYLIPQHLCSNAVGFLARCRINWLKNFLIKWFIQNYKITLDDALDPNYKNHPSFEDFFIRQVNAKMRPFISGIENIASPCDGTISQFGQIMLQRALQAKGVNFSIEEILGGDKTDAEIFADGNFITIYLSPKNFHRVFMPIDGTLKKMIYVPGKLFSVNQKTANKIPNLYAKNERLILFIETEFGPMAIILVGALIVSGLHTTWAGKVECKGFNKKICTTTYSPQEIALKKGSEVGYFTFGSTVILLFPKNKIIWTPTINIGQSIQIGQLISSFK